MKLLIDDNIRKKYPDLRIGVVVAKNLDNGTYSESLNKYVNETFISFASKFDSPQVFEEHKNIQAWREVYRSFGINPKKKKPTAESLLLRVIRNSFVPHISPVVDAYLCAETLHYLPIGGYDLNKIAKNINLRFAADNEEFLGVGALEKENTIAGEVVYSDDNRILTRCWNYRDCDFSKIDSITRSAALFVEAPLKTISDNELIETTNQIAANLEKFCGAACSVLYLSANEDALTLL